jgi:DNA-binding NarL/FixJ family response regulator
MGRMRAATVTQPAIPSGREATAVESLTEQERTILGLMAEGCSNQAICQRLCLAPKTVEAHIRSVLTKLGVGMSPDHHRRVLAVLIYLRSFSDEHCQDAVPDGGSAADPVPTGRARR